MAQSRVKVMTILGTRPELIKLSRVISELDRFVEHILVHTGQNFDYELNEIFFSELEIRKPDHFLEAAAETPAKTIANVIAKSDELFEKVKPDALLLYGDTNSCLAVIPAKRRRIPVFHMEAGNRCFDQRVPEELNRKVVDHLSDINMPLTEHARRYLLAEGLRPETVIKTGSTMKEILNHYGPAIERSDVLKRLQLDAGKYFIVSAHREENVDSPAKLRELVASLDAIADKYQLPVIVSVHPRTRQRLNELGSGSFKSGLIRAMKPLGFLDYVKLEKSAFCTLSDSGTITEESAILGFPAVTIRDAHERPEGMDAGTLVMASTKAESILAAIDVVTANPDRSRRTSDLILDYENANVSQKVVRIILSYVDYVNRTVWKCES